MLVSRFVCDKWQGFDEAGQSHLVGASIQSEVFPIAVPESLLDQEVLEGLIGHQLVHEWKQIRGRFEAINDASAQRFAECLPEWLNYAGGGLYGFGCNAAVVAQGGIYIGLYPFYEESKWNNADRNGYAFWLYYVVNGVAETNGPFGEWGPHEPLLAMYQHWCRVMTNPRPGFEASEEPET